MNGIVKRLNRTLCSSLAKVKEKDEDWNIYISAILFAYRTKRHATTRYTPFQLVYGCQAILPIETTIPIKPNEADKEINLEDSILNWAFELINKLPYQYNKAYKNTEKSQQKQKVRFDLKIHTKEFEIDEKV